MLYPKITEAILSRFQEKNKVSTLLKLTFILLISLGSLSEINAQCTPTFTGAACIGTPVQFFHNSTGATNVSWEFKQGATTIGTSNTENPSFSFTADGTYQACATLTTATGQACNSCIEVVVKPNPTVDVRLINSDTQCFAGNDFFFYDSSLPATGSRIVREDITFDDGGFLHFENQTYPFTFRKKFNDPAGGTYGYTVELEDENGCITKKYFPAQVTVRANLGLNLFIPSKEGCDSVLADLTNSSLIDLSEIDNFLWDFGDGTKNTTDWKPAPDHTYYSQGPNDGWWDVKLIVVSKDGCRDSVVAENAVRNLIVNPRIISNKDSSCITDTEFCFEIENYIITPQGIDTVNTIADMQGFLWNFGHDPNRFNNDALQVCHTYGIGPYELSFTYSHRICGNRTIYDTVLVVGPAASIEDPSNGIVIAEKERYQCVARDSIHFTNASKFYHNDLNMWNDDATFVQPNGHMGHQFDGTQTTLPFPTGNDRTNNNVVRLWDFGDQYAPRCTTDTRAGINVGKNCNFSRDSLPVHWYTPWDTIFQDSFYAKNRSFDQIKFNELTGKCYVETIDTNKIEEYREQFWKKIPRCFSAKLTLRDTVHPLANNMQCESSNSVDITLLKASAKNMRKSGVFCLGGANQLYGVNFHLDNTKPGCTSNWAEINFDANLDPTAWRRLHPASGQVQAGARPGGFPVTLPYTDYGPYGSLYSSMYTEDMIANKKDGCVKVGLVVGTGVSPNGMAPECMDTVYYEDFVCFPVLDADFEIISPDLRISTNQTPLKICKGDTLVLKLDDDNATNTDEVNELEWRFSTVTAGEDHNEVYNIKVNEKYYRYEVDPNNPNQLYNYLISTKSTLPVHNPGNTMRSDKIISSDTIVTAYITEWDTAVDFNPIWEIVNERLTEAGFDIFELTPVQIRKMFGESTCNLDTTGISKLLKSLEYIEPTSVTQAHYRHSTIAPLDSFYYKNKYTRTVNFVPTENGLFFATLMMNGGKDQCVRNSGKMVSVGFYSKMWYNDSIVCHSDLAGLKAKAQFNYYNVDPTIPMVLDTTDYWSHVDRKKGDPNTPNTLEDFVRWDWSKADDDKSNPATIFGSGKYGSTGYDTITLGGGTPQSLYYKEWGTYTLRLTTGDSTRAVQCRDTITKNLYVTDVKAGFDISQNRPQCTNIIEILDTSYMLDPCPTSLGRGCDSIVTYTIDFGDGKGVQQWPTKAFKKSRIANSYSRNGKFIITMTVETARGCRDTFRDTVDIPGPKPLFEPISTLDICVGDFVEIANRSIDPTSASQWIYNFGDGEYASLNYTESDGGRDTQYHVYTEAGTYNIFLQQFDSIPGTNKYCSAIYPDTSGGQQAMITVRVRGLDSAQLFVNNNPDSVVICPGTGVDFHTDANPIYTSHTFMFGDGDSVTTSDSFASHMYNNVGRYMVILNPIPDPLEPKACPMTDTVYVIVQDVIADFEIDTSRKPIFCFTNKSEGAVTYNWGYYHENDIVPNGDPFLVDDNNVTDMNERCNNYRDSIGGYWVCLEAINDIGCKDTVCKYILNNHREVIKIYNVFTPNKDSNGDGMNDNYVVEIEGHSDYDINILNRWGQSVFKSSNSTNHWNGTVNNDGADCPEGTYFYVIKYKFDGSDKEHLANGVITLIRE
jgi:gliding motility-associated-like protein